jgi:hypothetical protein
MAPLVRASARTPPRQLTQQAEPHRHTDENHRNHQCRLLPPALPPAPHARHPRPRPRGRRRLRRRPPAGNRPNRGLPSHPDPLRSPPLPPGPFACIPVPGRHPPRGKARPRPHPHADQWLPSPHRRSHRRRAKSRLHMPRLPVQPRIVIAAPPRPVLHHGMDRRPGNRRIPHRLRSRGTRRPPPAHRVPRAGSPQRPRPRHLPPQPHGPRPNPRRTPRIRSGTKATPNSPPPCAQSPRPNSGS